MTDSLLTTKLYIPLTRPEIVPRPRLIERLNESVWVGRKLTIISAPAGFGKTTLVSEWIHQKDEGRKRKDEAGGDHPSSLILNPSGVAWLSLDEGDNAPARFLAYFIAALNRVEGTKTAIGEGVLTMLQSPQPPPIETVLTPLINEIATIPDRIILVLDDYHLIETQPIHDALTFLLEHLPPQMHLVIATREDPRLPLSRLRARGQLTELRAADLRFTSSEAAEFLNQVMGLDLSAEDIATLETRTEGWIAGLQLAAISMQGYVEATSFIQSFTGSHHFVLDYLIEEVLYQQTESVQTFLLQTAILDRLTGSLCDAVRFGSAKSPSSSEGTADNGQQTLEYLEQANLFIVPLDEERRWYRYHHLFADLLCQRLRQTQPDQLTVLHHRASEWYEQNGFSDEAIEHALHAKDFERAAHLIEEQADVIWKRGEHTKLHRWLVGLPDKFVFSSPLLCIFHAWDQLVSGQQDATEQSLQAAEQELKTNNDRVTASSPKEPSQLPDSESIKLQGRAASIRVLLAYFRGDVPGIIKYARLALKYLPAQDLTWRSSVAITLGDAHSIKGEIVAAYRAQLDALETCKAAGDIYLVMLVNVKLAAILRGQGKLQETIEICKQQLQFSNEFGLSQTGLVGGILAIWGETLAEFNDLDRAIDQAKKGIELTERGGTLAMLGWSYMCMIRILFSRGELASAEEIIQKMEKIARKSDVPPWITIQMAAWQVRLWLVQDKLEAAAQWVAERGLYVDGESTHLNEINYVMEIEYVTLARILIAQEQLEQATGLLQRLLEAAEAGGRTSRVIEILILQALASQAGGDITRAMTTLEKALTLAEPEGFVRIFVDEGPPMSRLLYEALSRGIAPDYASRLLGAFPMAESEQTDPSKTQAPESELVEPLSEREIEVLQFIAEGLTNREIATRLYLAPSTVKVHTRNIYGKLGVNNRTQSVARGRALGILPPI